jgi:hypothetical protein
MNGFEMTLVIVVVSCATGIVNKFIRHKDKGHLKDLDDLLDRVDADDLEKRVRVLETVITDQNYELRKQFQYLEKE